MIYPLLQEHITHEVILDYYNSHQNEYQNVDRVQWHDVFIAVGPKHPTLEQARLFAKQVVELWQHGADISKLMEYDDGDSKLRKGMGAGELRGDIRPAELEPYLFHMKEGEIGPLVDIATGVHVFRLVKREVAGLMPFDDKVQVMIGNRLKGEMYERESRRIIHDLREKAKAAGTLVIVDRATGK
jgi:peptidyl-prolyl cis-trans isomerase SurA